MKHRNLLILAALGLSISVSQTAHADTDPFDDFRKQMQQGFEEFAGKAQESYDSFRDKVNHDYAEFMRNPWKPIETIPPLKPPVRKEKPKPDVVPEDEDPMPVNPRPVVIEEEVPVPKPKPQPQPVEPIKPVPVVKPLPDVQPTFYGTPMKVRGADLSGFSLGAANEDAFADGWLALSKASATANLISDCLKVRDTYRLPDYVFITFLDRLATKLKGANRNEKTLLMGYLLNQCGYKVRFGYEPGGRLHVLFASDGTIYNRGRYLVDRQWFYAYEEPQSDRIFYCDFSTPKEQTVSMGMRYSPKLDYAAGNRRDVDVKSYPGLRVSLTPNKNLIDLYNDYPESALTDSPYSKWAIHGNTPVSPEVSSQLYPALRKAVQGKNQYDAVQLLLKVAQSFDYGYDDEIWGRDRAFWMEESWHYPLSDCEDHAVNFSHMVRDILGLDACLIYYPGHLSACVAITDGTAKGDYIDYRGKRYTVCDATYFYAPAGCTAPSNDNAKAILIPLDK